MSSSVSVMSQLGLGLTLTLTLTLTLYLSILDSAALDVAQHSFVDEQSESVHWTDNCASIRCWTWFGREHVLCLKATSECRLRLNYPLCPIFGCCLSTVCFGRRNSDGCSVGVFCVSLAGDIVIIVVVVLSAGCTQRHAAAAILIICL